MYKTTTTTTTTYDTPQPEAADTLVHNCAFCGKEYPEGTPASGHPSLSKHIWSCPEHPLSATLSYVEELYDVLTTLMTDVRLIAAQSASLDLDDVAQKSSEPQAYVDWVQLLRHQIRSVAEKMESVRFVITDYLPGINRGQVRRLTPEQRSARDIAIMDYIMGTIVNEDESSTASVPAPVGPAAATPTAPITDLRKVSHPDVSTYTADRIREAYQRGFAEQLIELARQQGQNAAEDFVTQKKNMA